VEQGGVEEVRVDRALAGAEAVEVREALEGDVVGDLEGEAEAFGDIGHQAGEVFLGGKAVIGGVDADGAEDGGVLGKAGLLEPGFAELAAVGVAVVGIQETAPARVFPGGGPEVDPAGCEACQQVGGEIPFKGGCQIRRE
jgi:hypothetical protein